MNRVKLLRFCALLLLAAFAVSPILAHNHPGYWHESSAAANSPNWMATMPDNTPISEISIPGSHESMARHGGDVVECQSMTLNQQLNSGIRAIDIRCRHYYNVFTIHHGEVYQDANFGADVLAVVRDFLIANPTETIFMRLKQECSYPHPFR